VTDPKNKSPVSYILAPIEGCDDSGYVADPKEGLTGLKAIDDYTLEVKLKYPFADFALSLLHPVSSALPVDYINEIGYDEFREKPVGTGPYIVTEWVHNQNIDLARNPDYWDAANAGYVDRIHMPIITSEQTAFLQFQKGELDCSRVPSGQIRAVQEHTKVKSGEWTAKGWQQITTDFIGFNMNDKVVGGDAGLELRKAMYMAVETQSLITVAYQDQGAPATGIVPKGVPGWRADVSPYETDDVGGAEAALAAYGSDVPQISYWCTTSDFARKTAEVYQDSWKKIGITAKIANFEWSTFLDKISRGEGQVYEEAWIADYPSMDNFLYPLFQSQQPPSANVNFYKNEEFDKLLDQARATRDAEERYDLYAQAEAILLADATVIPTVYPRAFRVTNNRVGGFHFNSLGYIDMWKIWVK
jgi:peptide/nickel transport system substrate-binding protein/oligopeptide transport system substrate-binding protein